MTDEQVPEDCSCAYCGVQPEHHENHIHCSHPIKTQFEVSFTDQHGEKMVMSMETEVVVDKVAASEVLAIALESFERLVYAGKVFDKGKEKFLSALKEEANSLDSSQPTTDQ